MKTGIILTIAIIIASSNQTAKGLPPAGRVIGWGHGGGEKLVYFSEADSMGYISVGGHELSNVVAIAAEGLHAMALKADGTVVVWGYDPANKLVTVPPGLSNVVDISLGGEHNLVLTADGTVMSWGDDEAAPVPAGLSNVVAISGGGSYTLVLKRDGTIQQWGGPYGSPPAGLSNIVAIAECHSEFGDELVLTREGTVVEWPCVYNDDTYKMPPGLADVVAIASGDSHALALRKDGTVVAWGYASGDYMNPNFGQMNVPAGLSNVVAIAAGPAISLALKKDGTVAVWGDNGHHQVDLAAGLNNIVAIAAGQGFCLAIQNNGTLIETNIPAAAIKP